MQKIIWVTNQPTTFVAKNLGQKAPNGGGWLEQLSYDVSTSNHLVIIFPQPINTQLIHGNVDGIEYYGVPADKYSPKFLSRSIDAFAQIFEQQNPDVIHVWGTEYLHSYAAICAARQLQKIGRVVVSIQGLVSIYAHHYWAFSGMWARIPTLKDLLRGTGLYSQYRSFVLRGKYEKKSLKMIDHVIGRTDWDWACTKTMNPNLQYHYCQETLRSNFYSGRWDKSKAREFQIFVSQSQYPLKGFHIMLKALRILVRSYPEVRLVTTGIDVRGEGFIHWLKETGYQRYLRHMIEKYNLADHVIFKGALNADEMKATYLKSRVFVSASSIENSSNSIGEAMLLGVPVVSSDVGGIKSMMVHEKQGLLYQADSPEMLAANVSRLFEDEILDYRLSSDEIRRATCDHNPNVNINRLLSIYQSIIEGTSH